MAVFHSRAFAGKIGTDHHVGRPARARAVLVVGTRLSKRPAGCRGTESATSCHGRAGRTRGRTGIRARPEGCFQGLRRRCWAARGCCGLCRQRLACFRIRAPGTALGQFVRRARTRLFRRPESRLSVSCPSPPLKKEIGKGKKDRHLFAGSRCTRSSGSRRMLAPPVAAGLGPMTGGATKCEKRTATDRHTKWRRPCPGPVTMSLLATAASWGGTGIIQLAHCRDVSCVSAFSAPRSSSGSGRPVLFSVLVALQPDPRNSDAGRALRVIRAGSHRVPRAAGARRTSRTTRAFLHPGDWNRCVLVADFHGDGRRLSTAGRAGPAWAVGSPVLMKFAHYDESMSAIRRSWSVNGHSDIASAFMT